MMRARESIELSAWGVLFALCFFCLFALASCAGPKRAMRGVTVFAEQSDGEFSSTSGGAYGSSTATDGDTEGYTFGVSFALDKLFEPEPVYIIQAGATAVPTDGAASTPTVAGMAVAAPASPAPTWPCPAEIPFATDAPTPPPIDLPWWKDVSLLIGYAAVLSALLGGGVVGVRKLQSKKKG